MGPCHVSTSAALPTATIRSPSTASASACGRVLSTVQIFALVTIRSAAGLDCADAMEHAITKTKLTARALDNFILELILLPFSPLEFGPQNIKERPARELKQFHFQIRFPAPHHILLIEGYSLLAVDRQIRPLSRNDQPRLDDRCIMYHQRPIREGMRGYRSDDKTGNVGGKNGAAGGKRVRRGACRRGYDQAVSLIVGDKGPVDANFEVGNASHGALVQDYFIERVIIGHALAVAVDLAMEHGPQAELASAGINLGQRMRALLLFHLGEKTERTQGHARNRNAGAHYLPRRGEQRAIAAQHDHKIRPRLDQVFPLHQLAFGTELTGHRVCCDRITMGAQPLGNLAYNRPQVRLAELGDDRRFLHQNSACKRNSLFPSMPRIGDSINSMCWLPSASTFWW